MNSLFKTVTGLRPANDFGAREDIDMTHATSTIFLKEIEVEAFIGVYEEEKNKRQRLLISLDLDVAVNDDWKQDNIHDVLSYDDVLEMVQRTAEHGHIHLLETFAEKIISECLKHPLVLKASVTVEKPDIFTQAKTVGVRIQRFK